MECLNVHIILPLVVALLFTQTSIHSQLTRITNKFQQCIYICISYTFIKYIYIQVSYVHICTIHIIYIYIYIYMYIYEVNKEINLTGVGEGAISFSGLLHFSLDTYLTILSVKQGGIKYHFLNLCYDSTWDWTPLSQAIGKHSMSIYLYIYIYIICIKTYIYIYIYIFFVSRT